MQNELKLNHVYPEDCLETLKRFPDNYFHSIVTDPPYGLSKQIDPIEVMKAWINNESYKATGKGFMGNEWDNFVPQPEIWKECLRVLRPGGYLLAFSSTRTQDWMAMALRFGGFEIVDTIMWVYGNGMPKFHNVGKMIDKTRGGKTVQAEKWEGFHPTVKPAVEPIIMARKPIEGTYVDNCLKWGCGALNIPATKVDRSDGCKTWDKPKGGCWKPSVDNDAKQVTNKSSWTANLLHDGSEEVEKMFPNTKSGKAEIGTGSKDKTTTGIYGKKKSEITSNYADKGSASRFFNSFPFEETDRIIYTGKAKASEKNKGLDKLEKKASNTYGQDEWTMQNMRNPTFKANTHPTVKPLKLMRHLVRLVTPPEGICYEPFGGSGTTGVACVLEGLDFVMSEREAEYIPIAEARIADAQKEVAARPLNLFKK